MDGVRVQKSASASIQQDDNADVINLILCQRMICLVLASKQPNCPVKQQCPCQLFGAYEMLPSGLLSDDDARSTETNKAPYDDLSFQCARRGWLLDKACRTRNAGLHADCMCGSSLTTVTGGSAQAALVSLSSAVFCITFRAA